MRCLDRNKQMFWYCTYSGRTPVLDGDGYETGETKVTYSAPVKCRANISPAYGEAQTEQFGNLAQYDKVIVTDKDLPIDENTVLFIDKQPEYDANNNPLYDYLTVKVAKSLNYTAYAVKKAGVS